MERCRICKKGKLISKSLGVCRECIFEKWRKAKPFVIRAHKKTREKFGLPYPAPKARKGVKCPFCVNQCVIGEGKKSFCGLRVNENGRLVHLAGTSKKGILESYFDPLPTNCVAAFACRGGKKFGMKNLAVFYGACSLDCLFCQNWHFKYKTISLSPIVSAEELAGQADKDTFCVCYFGGDPTPQMPHALATSKIILKKHPKVRICFETNGTMNKNLAKEMGKVALKSQGVIKFDLKAFDEHLHVALTGVSNKWTLKNFKMLATQFSPKADYPFLVASTLLVPGYINEQKVEKIAKFIAKLNPQIPYSLLGFYPCFEMSDLPATSYNLALRCYQKAKKAGLKNVNLGNVHLLV